MRNSKKKKNNHMNDFSSELQSRLSATFGADGPPPDAPPAGLVAANVGNIGDISVVKLKVFSDTLHIRSAPSTTANVIGNVPNNSNITIVGKLVPVAKTKQYPSGGGFYPVNTPVGNGFAWAGYVFPLRPQPFNPVVPPSPAAPTVPPIVPVGPNTPVEPKAAGIGWGWWGLLGLAIAGTAGYVIKEDKKKGKQEPL